MVRQITYSTNLTDGDANIYMISCPQLINDGSYIGQFPGILSQTNYGQAIVVKPETLIEVGKPIQQLSFSIYEIATTGLIQPAAGLVTGGAGTYSFLTISLDFIEFD